MLKHRASEWEIEKKISCAQNSGINQRVNLIKYKSIWARQGVSIAWQNESLLDVERYICSILLKMKVCKDMECNFMHVKIHSRKNAISVVKFM